MKRRFILFTLLTLIITGIHAQSKYVIRGKLQGIQEEVKVMLHYMDGDRLKTDSAITKKRVFRISGSISEPVEASIIFKSLLPDERASQDDRNTYAFYLGKGITYITGTIPKDIAIKGGKAQQDFLLLQAQLKPQHDKMDQLINSLNKYRAEKNDSAAVLLYPGMREVTDEIFKAQDSFIRAHHDSYVTLGLLTDRASIETVNPSDPLFDQLSSSLKNTAKGRKLANLLMIAKNTAIGALAMDFTQADTSGKPVSLSSFRGKYVLVDFWASWCGPCRKDNPNVVRAYDEFKDRNFEVISISLDDDKRAWESAIQKDNLTWTHLSDLHGWFNEVARMYGINSVPRNFLIDPNGIILAKDLHGDDIYNKLKRLIK